ncbi:MAG: lipase secretion chaperone [Pseudomonadota bacterium]
MKAVYAGMAAVLAAVAFFATPARQGDAMPASAREPDLFSFVRSMDGTRPDGAARENPDSTLVVDHDLRLLFDYYLAAVNEKSVAEIQLKTEREIDNRLKPGPAAEAKRLLARYLDYRRALAELEKNAQLGGFSTTAMRERLDAMRRERERFFSTAEAAGLFGADDSYDADMLERAEINQDRSLSGEQRKKKLAALDAALPPAMREAREAPTRILRVEESVDRMRSQGASDDDVYRMRAAALNPEAAGRLAEVDLEDAAWKKRIAAYLAERDRQSQSGARLPPAQREADLQQLRQSRFSPDEQKRLPAYE